MNERPFRRVVLLCDAACDIHVAVADAAALAARWGATLHGVFLDDENLHRFAALPFGQHVSLSAADLTEALDPGDMASLAAALGAGMRRALAEVAEEQGLQWTFGMLRDVPSAAPVAAEEGDILIIEAAARTFSGAWRPRAAWDKSPSAFSGTTLLKSRGRGARGILLLLPERADERDKVLAAGAALADAEERIVLIGDPKVLATTETELARHFDARQRRHIGKRPLGADRTKLLAGGRYRLIVLSATDAPDAVDEPGADILLVR